MMRDQSRFIRDSRNGECNRIEQHFRYSTVFDPMLLLLLSANILRINNKTKFEIEFLYTVTRNVWYMTNLLDD